MSTGSTKTQKKAGAGRDIAGVYTLLGGCNLALATVVWLAVAVAGPASVSTMAGWLAAVGLTLTVSSIVAFAALIAWRNRA